MSASGIDQNELKELLKEYEENPFDPNRKSPADVMRIFFQFNADIVPVISRRNILLGIITKESITAEMSDIARFSGVTIDKFISRISKKFSFDELIPHVSSKSEFTVINLFGEVQGSWTRLQLLAACENAHLSKESPETETEAQIAEQRIQWMVYHVLEHIPRPLYAVNEKGKTVFYNLYFEDLYLNTTGKAEVDSEHAEKIFSDNKSLDVMTRPESGEIYFKSKETGWTYEKVPMKDHRDNINGYLYYFGKDISSSAANSIVSEGSTLISLLENSERSIIVNAIDSCGGDPEAAARKLGVPKNSFLSKISKYGIRIS